MDGRMKIEPIITNLTLIVMSSCKENTADFPPV